jgi:hypothetical protein
MKIRTLKARAKVNVLLIKKGRVIDRKLGLAAVTDTCYLALADHFFATFGWRAFGNSLAPCFLARCRAASAVSFLPAQTSPLLLQPGKCSFEIKTTMNIVWPTVNYQGDATSVATIIVAHRCNLLTPY